MNGPEGYYTPVGIYTAIADTPGLGTVVLRDRDGAQKYLQRFDAQGTILGFSSIKFTDDKPYISTFSNTTVRVGDPMLYGLVLPCGRPVIENVSDMTLRMTSNVRILDDYPFAAFHVGQLTASNTLFLRAISNEAVQTALRRGIVSIDRRKHKAPQREGWSDEAVEILKTLWGCGLSASSIASVVGNTRNAVIGKVHRLGLVARDEGSERGSPRLKIVTRGNGITIAGFLSNEEAKASMGRIRQIHTVQDARVLSGEIGYEVWIGFEGALDLKEFADITAAIKNVIGEGFFIETIVG